jgi:hypothetical protein
MGAFRSGRDLSPSGTKLFREEDPLGFSLITLKADMKSALLILIVVSLNACSTNTKVAHPSSLTPAQQADQEAWQDASQRALEDVHQAGSTAIRLQSPNRN